MKSFQNFIFVLTITYLASDYSIASPVQESKGNFSKCFQKNNFNFKNVQLFWSLYHLHFECTESRLNLGQDYLQMTKLNLNCTNMLMQIYFTISNLKEAAKFV